MGARLRPANPAGLPYTAARPLRITIREESIVLKDTRELASTETHKPARPLKYFKDRDGNGWLCDKDIDPDADFAAQGCWRCEEMAFPDGGR
jgi:hypothetical protein